jgi:hypothetical protein
MHLLGILAWNDKKTHQKKMEHLQVTVPTVKKGHSVVSEIKWVTEKFKSTCKLCYKIEQVLTCVS